LEVVERTQFNVVFHSRAKLTDVPLQYRRTGGCTSNMPVFDLQSRPRNHLYSPIPPRRASIESGVMGRKSWLICRLRARDYIRRKASRTIDSRPVTGSIEHLGTPCDRGARFSYHKTHLNDRIYSDLYSRRNRHRYRLNMAEFHREPTSCLWVSPRSHPKRLSHQRKPDSTTRRLCSESGRLTFCLHRRAWLNRPPSYGCRSLQAARCPHCICLQ
jgi:hypothetical protein